jgi:hypothetical protein
MNMTSKELALQHTASHGMPKRFSRQVYARLVEQLAYVMHLKLCRPNKRQSK